jgi:type I restriction enzyme, S subunit
MERFKLSIPSAKVLEVFDALLLPLLRKGQETPLESATLSTIRDALLPKLLSGEIRVKDAEDAAAEALA